MTGWYSDELQHTNVILLNDEMNQVYDIRYATIIYIKNPEGFNTFRGFLHDCEYLYGLDLQQFKNIKKCGIWYSEKQGTKCFWNLDVILDYHKELVYKAVDPVKRGYFNNQLQYLWKLKENIMVVLDKLFMFKLPREV